MNTIPPQLDKPGFKFVLLQENWKKPIELDWTTKNTYESTNPKLLKHIENGGNYGVLTGVNNLIVLDFDSFDAWEEWKPKLPYSYAVKTALKKLVHVYYFTDKPENFPVKDKDGKTLLDVKGIGGQVVGVGSKITKEEFEKQEEEKPVEKRKTWIHEEPVQYYEVYKDLEITWLPNEILEELKKQKQSNTRSIKKIIESGVIEGSRNEDFFNLACKLRQEGISKETALNTIKGANNISKTPLGEYELKNIVNSAYSYQSNVRQLLKAKLTKEATEQLVKEIKSMYVLYTTRDDEKSECWIYNDGVFKPEGKSYIEEYIRNSIGEWYSTQITNQVIAKITADTYIEQDDFFNRQNEYPYLVPVLNGVLNINTKELTKHKPEYCFFNKLPVEYKPVLDCPNIKKFLCEVLSNEKDIRIIQEFYGSCLLKEYKYEKCLMLIGKGRNGKGKTLELLKHLIGIENCAEISPQDIESDQFAMSELVNKMVNMSGDINSTALNNTGRFKNLTGRDLLMGARKFKTRIKFRNYAKFIFSANEMPDTKDLSDGFFSRWIIIEFNYQFLKEQDILGRSEEELRFIKLQDPEIIEKITTPSELSGFLNWCLEGYSTLKLNGGHSDCQSINDVRKLWIRKANSVSAFIMDFVSEDYDEFIPKNEFKLHYVVYCRKYGLKQMSDRNIRDTLTKNLNVSEIRPSIDYKQVDAWSGIRFNDALIKH